MTPETRERLEEAGHSLEAIDRLELRQEMCWRCHLPCTCPSSGECLRVGEDPLVDAPHPRLVVEELLAALGLSANQALALMGGDARVRFHGSHLRRRD